MKKRLIFHIGSHKTATTFLQGSFANSAAAFAEMGVLYPQAGRIYDGHFKLCWDLKNPDLAQSDLDSLPNWAALLAEIDAAPHQTVLVSAESFGWGTDVSRLAGLADRFDVTVVFYLRSPDSHLESFYNQIVKDFGTRETRSLETYVAEEPLGFLDTTKILRPWAEMFGPKAIKLRLFGNQFLPDGILPDVLRALGFKTWPEFAAPTNSVLHKVSLPPDALEYLRLTNLWLTSPNGHHDHVIKLAQLSAKRADDLQETRAGILSLRARQTVRTRFRASQAMAAQTYLGLAKAPFPPSDATEFAGFAQRLPEATAQIVAKVAALLRTV